MAEKPAFTTEDVEALQSVLRSDVAVQIKVDKIDVLKSDIKHDTVAFRQDCIPQLFEVLRVASSNQSRLLAKVASSTIGHLLHRLSLQKSKYLQGEDKQIILPFLVERLGDPKEEIRSLAVKSLATMNKVVPTDVGHYIRDVVMAGKNPRAKEASLQWLLQMYREQGMRFKSYVPRLMTLLQDADPGVREKAKTTVIELFTQVSGPVRSELNSALVEHNIRPSIRAAIEKGMAPEDTSHGPPEYDAQDLVEFDARPALSASVSSKSTLIQRPVTPLPDTRTEKVEPEYINTVKDIDHIFTQMHGFFDGNEHERNWKPREESAHRLRKLMAGNALTDFHDVFLEGLRSLLLGIIKAINSLRTSLSKEGCALVQDIAVNYGPAMDPMVEMLMQTFVKLSGATKKIAQQQANVCVNTIISRVTYTHRILTHVTDACTNINVQRRVFGAEWLNTLLKKEAHHKSQLEHNGGLDLIVHSVNKCLTDANPDVREKMRPTYWTFHGMWPARAEKIFKELPDNIQNSVEQDPHNPNPPKKAEPVARPGLGLSRSTMGRASKPSLKETMKAQRDAHREALAAKKNPSRPASAMAAKSIPSRPGSAMAHFSPPRPTRAVHGSSTTSATTVAPYQAMRQKPTTSGGLSNAPVRPTKKRPEMAPRPATAGPYSVRGGVDTELSPPQKPKAVTPKTMVTTPKRTVPKARPAHKPTASGSSIPTPTRLTHAKSSPVTSPTKSPTSQILQPGPLLGSPQPEDNLSLITPTTPTIPAASLASPDLVAPELATAAPDQTESPVGTPSRALRVYEDPLTAEQSTPRLTPPAVLEEKPVNEDAANLVARQNGDGSDQPDISSDKAKQHARLIESALAKIKSKTLDVHGFRKLQSILRDNKAPLSDDKFDALLLGLFDYLEDPQSNLAPEKVQDVKAQNLATVRLLLKKYRDHFQPHISKGLESLMSARAVYDARTHIVSGLELLADELVSLGDAQEIATVLTRRMTDTALDSAAGRRSLSIGLHVLKEMVDAKAEYVPTDQELDSMAALCMRCLESTESGVRMDAVQLCVALQGRVGDVRFWDVMKDVKDDPKSLITYYIVKRQREREAASGVA